MFEETISPKTKLVLEKIAQADLKDDFYLAGGTALAIQLGHRESIDLDWFCLNNFSGQKLKQKLSKLGAFKLTGEEEGTINGILDEVKVSFFHYPYQLIFPLLENSGVKLADEKEIATMKIDAMSSRGSKKDFIDIYFLLKKYSLERLLEFFEKKFQTIDYNRLHILKSLVYFIEADKEPMPKMTEEIDWEKVKEEIRKKTNELMDK